MRGRRDIAGWVGVSSLDALGRLSLQVIGTLILARLLTPDLFGLAALSTTLVVVVQTAITLSLEEALAQRRTVRRSHYETALAIALLAMVPAYGVLWVAATVVGSTSEADRLPSLILVAGAALLAAGPVAVGTGAARRMRRFGLIALGNLIGAVIGLGLALMVAFLGGGVWALIIWRLASPFSVAFVLIIGMKLSMRPRLHSNRLREIYRFVGIQVLDRSLETLVQALFHIGVSMLFGLTAVGLLNMGMRLVEPLRGAVQAITHNVSFALMAPAQDDADRLAGRLLATLSQTSFLAAPTFLGLAAVMPTLLPMAAGSGWEGAVPIAQALAVAALVGLLAGVPYTALSALGRPEAGVASGVFMLAALLFGTAVTQFFGTAAIGLVRILMDTVSGIPLYGAVRRRISLPFRRCVHQTAGPVVSASLMAMLVWSVPGSTDVPAAALLPLQIAMGVVVFGALSWVLAREPMKQTIAAMTSR